MEGQCIGGTALLAPPDKEIEKNQVIGTHIGCDNAGYQELTKECC